MKICKFGGSSLSCADQIRRVCDIILDDPTRKIVVVSAPGKRFSSDTKVTDLLIRLANAVLQSDDYTKDLNTVVERYEIIADHLDLEKNIVAKIRQDLEDRIACKEIGNSKFMDLMKAAGEDNCAKLVAEYFLSIGKPASYINPKEAGMFLTDEYGNAQVLDETYRNLACLKDMEGIGVFPGFFGYTKSGDVATFSRGGSDITGAILAAAMDVAVYENWTDVDAVFAVNPSLVSNPYPIKELTYDEMRELAYAGFSVLHDEALSPAFHKSIPVHIRNTNNPDSPGTLIVKKRKNYDGMVTGIAGAKGFLSINLSKYLMNREIGYIARVLKILADEKIPFEHIPSGIDSVSIVLKQANITPEKEKKIFDRFTNELGAEKISVNSDLAIVMIVGEAMAHTVGVTARAASCLSKAGINLEIIIQGASEISVIFGVREEYCNYALKVLYSEFFKS
jgi:aspartate kinase